VTLTQILTILGLTSDIIGVLLLFKYGLIAELHNAILTANDIKKDKEDVKEFKKTISKSKLALILLVFGFILQLISAIIPIFINHKINLWHLVGTK
jgi:hypothetical protein